MDWLTNEILFYGGMIVSACSLLFGMIYSAFLYIKKIRLNVRLDEEYGKEL